MLHLLITANSQGDFRYFPRLQTAITQLRGKLEGKIVLLDTGLAWSTESWVCQATENRAPYLVLDAMAYTVAFADGLNAEGYGILRHQISVALTDEFQGYHLNHDEETYWIQRHRGEEAVLMGDQLKLPMPPAYSLYQVSLEGQEIVEQMRHEFSPSTLPNSTIAGMVEFVVGEARYYRQTKKPD